MNFSGGYFGGGIWEQGQRWEELTGCLRHLQLWAGYSAISYWLCLACPRHLAEEFSVEFFFLQPCLFIALRVHNITHATSPSQLLPFLTPVSSLPAESCPFYLKSSIPPPHLGSFCRLSASLNLFLVQTTLYIILDSSYGNKSSDHVSHVCSISPTRL